MKELSTRKIIFGIPHITSMINESNVLSKYKIREIHSRAMNSVKTLNGAIATVAKDSNTTW